MNEKGVDSSKSEVIKEENKEEAKEENKEEESTRKRKLGTRKKMKSRKRRYIQNTSEDDNLNVVYQLVMDRYQDEIPKGFDRVLWGDLMVMFNPYDEDELEFTSGLEYSELEATWLHRSIQQGTHTIPDEYLLKFHNVADAKSLWNAINQGKGELGKILPMRTLASSTKVTIVQPRSEGIEGKPSIGYNGGAMHQRNESSSQSLEAQEANDRFSKADGYHAVPPPITGNFLTPRADISFVGLDEYAIRKKIIESKTTDLNTKPSETVVSKMRKVRSQRGVSTSSQAIQRSVAGHRSVEIEVALANMNLATKLIFQTRRFTMEAAIKEDRSLRDHAMNEICSKKGIKRDLCGKTSQQNEAGKHYLFSTEIDSLGKFDGKSDEGYLLGYSTTSKAFRVYNKRTKRVEENLHINFLEDQPNVTRTSPNWMFDLDFLTNSMNYIPVSVENHVNVDAVLTDSSPSESSSKLNDVQDSEDVADKEGQHQMNKSSVSTATTPYVSAASTPTSANAGESSFVYLGGKILIDVSTLPNVDLPVDPTMHDLEDDSDAFSNDGIFNGACD
ncbi:hypothetical protein Tco_0185353 [Tanacetum coccineum]